MLVTSRAPSSWPSVNVTLVGLHLGRSIAKAVASSVLEGRLSPELLGEALCSSASVRGYLQSEALRYVAVRVSLRTPARLQWLLDLIIQFFCAGAKGSSAWEALTRRSVLHQVTALGLQGTVASALAATVVQFSITTCRLVTSNSCFWRVQQERMSLAQYRYDSVTVVCGGVGTVVGGGVGAAVGSLLLPGFGTAFGSVVGSMGGSCLPGYLRSGKGPDKLRASYLRELQGAQPLAMRDTDDGFVELFHEVASDDGGEEDARSPNENTVQPTNENDTSGEEKDGTWVMLASRHSDRDTQPGPSQDGTSQCTVQSQMLFATQDDTSSASTDPIDHEMSWQRLPGRVEYLGRKSWDELTDAADKCDPHEMLLLFAIGDLHPRPSEC